MGIFTQKISRSFFHLLSVIEHHRFTTILVVIAALWMIYMLSTPGRHQSRPTSPAVPTDLLTEIQPDARKAFASLEVSENLSSHEYDARTQYIKTHLEKLRNEIDVDSVYIFSFHPPVDSEKSAPERQVSNTFEINRNGITPRLYRIQDVPFYQWEHIKNAQIGYSRSYSIHGYGTELYDKNKTLIGYLGVSYLKEPRPIGFDRAKIARVHEVVRNIEIALSSPGEEFYTLYEE